MNDNTNKLVRTVGFWGLVAMCINAVVGSGVFLLPHESYTLLGPFSLWAPLLFAIPVFILVLNFAEAASHFDKPGGAYLYAKSAFGDFIGFETGWMNWIARVTSLASLSNGFVLALALLWPELGAGMNRAIVITSATLILAIIHFLGVRYGAASIYIFTFGKLVPLVGFIILSLAVWRTNPIPASFTLPGPETNWVEAALFMLFAYAGFENLGVPASEFKNPRRDLPLALLTGILAIAALYALVQLGAMSALPDLSQTKTPIASAAAELIGPIGAFIVTIGALLSMAGTNSGTMLEGSRMLYALSLDRRMGPLSYVHPRFRTPSFAIAVHTAVALGLALGGSFRQLALISAMARLTTYLVTCLAVPRLRKLNEGFRTPGYIVPILGVVVSLVFVVNLDKMKLLVAAIALSIGALLYFLSKPRVVH
ncbi:MAG TPA: APC family permease [Thermoanaerobaculia bacterium]|jgi:amino acid transporter|nr:APC family permease [Thermoanaerobaculia bacterium]